MSTSPQNNIIVDEQVDGFSLIEVNLASNESVQLKHLEVLHEEVSGEKNFLTSTILLIDVEIGEFGFGGLLHNNWNAVRIEFKNFCTFITPFLHSQCILKPPISIILHF